LKVLNQPLCHYGIESLNLTIMKTKLLLSALLSFSFYLLSSQVPQGFNYQAIARDGSGNPIINATLKVKLSILSDTTGFYLTGGSSASYIWEEEQTNVKTNAFGLFTVVFGNPNATKIQGTAASFSAIDWSKIPLYIGVKIANPTNYKNLGSVQLWAVPYSMVTDSTKALLKGSKLSVVSGNDQSSGALFEVKRKDGQTVFAVYPDSVNIFVPQLTGKGATKGGFAIGSFDTGKSPSQRLFVVNPDSVRVYIDTNPGKGATKGGFAIGGFDQGKGGNANFFNVKTSSTEIINPSQNRILWYPVKNAFLAGRVLIEQPDSVGVNSFATGYESKAKGQYSQALGYQAIARGNFSTSIGYQSVTQKDNSFAFGQWAQALNNESYAFGKGAIAEGFRSFAFGSAGIDSSGQKTGVVYAKGDYSFAFGQGSQALGNSSIAIGAGDTASYNYSQAFGLFTKSSGHTSTTFGFKTIASMWTAMAIGAETISSGNSSFAGGLASKASGNWSLAFGNNTLADGVSSVAMGMGTVASNGFSFAMGWETQATGIFSAAFGRGSIANGFGSTAIGDSTIASGGDSFSGGGHSKATGNCSLAFGGLTIASGGSSVALGSNTSAVGTLSFAMGDSSIAKNTWSCAFGNRTIASGDASFTGGWKCESDGHHSFSFGEYNKAIHGGDVAFGDNTKAEGGDSFSTGYFANANGSYSAAFGKSTIVNSFAALVLGRFNDTIGMTNSNWYVSTDPAFEIGNGTSNTNRENAFTVLQNGNTAIGHSSPTQMLDVNGNARFRSVGSGTYVSSLSITSDGTLTTATSDISMKKDIVTINQALQKVLEMNGVYFSWKNDNLNNRRIGFIAQEMETVLPEVVFTNPVDGLKGINYPEITAVLAQAVKEQQQQIESTKLENQKLKSELDELKTIVNTLIANQTSKGNN
jgi:Chaperone of endosialidase/Head domain of trimeric autotransporter adhesin